MEQWRAVPGLPTYEVSDLGNARRVKSDGSTRPIKRTGHVPRTCLGPRHGTVPFRAAMLLAFGVDQPPDMVAKCRVEARGDATLLSRLYWGPRSVLMDRDRRVRRFMAKVSIDVVSGCWLWNGPIDSYGYGMHGKRRAHRFSFEIHNSPPGDLFVCHRCDNPPCVNPDHLFLGTQQDNMNDMVAKDRSGPKRGRIAIRSAIRKLVAHGPVNSVMVRIATGCPTVSANTVLHVMAKRGELRRVAVGVYERGERYAQQVA